MSFHTDYARWRRLLLSENCPVCNAAPMPSGMEDSFETEHSCLDAEPVDCIRGTCGGVARSTPSSSTT